jgi:hypothetical protein
MWLLPYRTFRLETRLSVEEVVARLAAAIGRESRWRRCRTHQYTGYLDENGFRTVRVIPGSNSFLPTIRGRIGKTMTGSVVEGTMMLHPVIPILFAISLVSIILRLLGWLPGLWLPREFVVLAFMYTVSVGVFHYEVFRDLRLLRQIIAAESDAPDGTPTAL